MMDFVVDIQGFRDVNRHFLPKEVAVIALQELIVGHWIVGPPCNFLQLPPDIKTTNSYCTVHVHGIQWFEGEVSLRRLRHHLYKVVKKARNIYVRGDDKRRYLENVLGRCVINLEEWKSPTFNKLAAVFPNSLVCASHIEKHIENKKDFCALFKANLLRKWFYSILPEEWREANETIQSERFYAALLKYRNDRRKAFRFGQPGGVDEVDGDEDDGDDEDTCSSTQTEKANIDEEEEDDDDINIVFSEKAPIEEFSNQVQDGHENNNACDTCAKSEYNRCVCC